MHCLRTTVATFAVAFGAVEIAGGQAPANDCADPYWQHSLRCVVAAGEVPQPVPAAPSLPGQIKEYTRVDLESDRDVRCLDGTRPVLYMNPAVGGASDHRILSFTGSGSCAEEQASTVVADLDSRSELAQGEDPSGPPPSVYFWMPDCGAHAGSYSNESFFDVELQGTSSWTMRALLEDFVQAPSTGAADAEIDGFGGRSSICSPLVFAD